MIVDQEGDSTFAGTLNINDKTGSGITDRDCLRVGQPYEFIYEGGMGIGSPPSNFDSFLKIAEGTLVFGAPVADVIVDGGVCYTAASAGVDVSARLVDAAASGSGAVSSTSTGTDLTYKIDTGGQNIVFGSFIGAWEGSPSVSVQKPNYGSPSEGHHDGISYPVSGYIGQAGNLQKLGTGTLTLNASTDPADLNTAKFHNVEDVIVSGGTLINNGVTSDQYIGESVSTFGEGLSNIG